MTGSLMPLSDTRWMYKRPGMHAQYLRRDTAGVTRTVLASAEEYRIVGNTRYVHQPGTPRPYTETLPLMVKAVDAGTTFIRLDCSPADDLLFATVDDCVAYLEALRCR